MRTFITVILLSIQFKLMAYWDQKIQYDDYIFGYGSLVNSHSREASLEAPTEAIAARISAAFGYRRAWNVQTHSYTALGIEKSSQASTINGVIYPVQNGTMSIWDQRETIYDRILVPWEMAQAASWQGLPTHGKLWIYVPKNPKAPTAEHPILQSYVDVCMLGFLNYSPEFAQEFLETTHQWSLSWLNDRIQSRRPWVHLKKSRVIDELLSNFPRENNTFRARKYLVDSELSATNHRSRVL